jgi:hypothetical protein
MDSMMPTTINDTVDARSKYLGKILPVIRIRDSGDWYRCTLTTNQIACPFLLLSFRSLYVAPKSCERRYTSSLARAVVTGVTP